MPLDPLTHPDADALRGAVAAAPDDDAPRLAYADWLSDHGGPPWRARAEFIRLQIDAHRRAVLAGKVADPLVADRLLFSFYQEWWRELPPWLRTGDAGPTPAPTQGYSRGFVNQFLRSGEWWAKGRELPPRVPIEQLEVWYRKGKGDPFAVGDVPQLATVRRLTVCFDAPAIGPVVTALARSPHLGRVRSLTLWGPTDAGTGPSLAAAAGLSEITHLTLKATADGPAAAGPLAAIPAALGVRVLELQGVGTTAELCDLVRSPGLGSLTGLTLAGREVTDAVARAFAASPTVGGLRALALKQTAMTDAGLEAIAAAPLASLTALDLQGWQAAGRGAPIGRLARGRVRARFPFALLDG
jgi:uncharacterized protein (TIGR02996 family)